MRQKRGLTKEPAERVVKEIRRAIRKHSSAEEKVRVVREGLRGEDSIAEFCRREGCHMGIPFSNSCQPRDALTDRAQASLAKLCLEF
jgi:transposase